MKMNSLYKNGVHKADTANRHPENGIGLQQNKSRLNNILHTQARATKVVRLRRSAKKLIKTQVYALETLLEQKTPTWKRCLDLTLASLALLALAPLFLGIMTLITIASPGPVFFKQIRIGKMGKPFTIWKFRTMKINAETASHEKHFKNLMNSDNEMQKLDAKKDPRIIPFGNILRQTGIDELPQLVNVIRGEMSIVGPRPCLPYEAENYLRWQHNRFDVLPGITGLWQVSGKNKTTFKQMIRLDINYTRNISLWEDLRIVLMTIPAIIAQVKG